MSDLMYFITIFVCFAEIPFILGIYSFIAGIYMYRTDKFPSYFNEPTFKFGSPRRMGIGIIIRGIFAILFGLIVVVTTFLQ
jgi:hypothetical protein